MECRVPRCKLVLLGQECVGKSNLVRRLTGQPFEAEWISTQGGEPRREAHVLASKRRQC